MPTLYVIDGFEHGLVTATSGTGVYDTVVGAPVSVTTPVRTGARALEIGRTAGAEESVRYTVPAANRQITTTFYVRFAALPTDDQPGILSFLNATGTNAHVHFRNAANGGPALGITMSGATPVLLSGTITTDTWYRVDVEMNTSTTTYTIKAQVDGGTEAVCSLGGLTAGDITSVRLGAGADGGTASTAYYDDWVISITAGDYPIGPVYVEQLVPTSDGAHSTGTAGNFKDTGGTNITDATTTAYTLVDDAVIDTTPTDYIQQAGGATNYVEVAFADPSQQADTPIDVRGYVAYEDAATTGTTTSGCDFYDTDTSYATLNTTVKTHADTGNTTIKTYSNSAANSHLLTRPSGGWNITKVNALRARVGYGDGSPIGRFSTVMAEVAMAPAPVTPVGYVRTFDAIPFVQSIMHHSPI